jgi:hypothetical protein
MLAIRDALCRVSASSFAWVKMSGVHMRPWCRTWGAGGSLRIGQ